MYAYVRRFTAALASTVLGLYIHTPSCKLCAVLSKAQVQECSYVKRLVSINTVSSKNEKISFAHYFYVAQSSSHKIWLSEKESMRWAFETCTS
uniref:Putative secreted protein n=1 Tax=Ixodes ricinus TaxID=34613 RepID=A0A6B0U8D9_IXORI